jgi:hypothetical protein
MPRRSLIHLATLYKTIVLCFLLVPAAAANDWKFEDTRNDVREFVPGGNLHVHLSVGDLHITHGEANKLRLRYTIKSSRERDVKDANVDFDVHGKDADLEFHAPGSNTQFDVELEVPQQTNLDVHGKVGDITIIGVEGDKDVELNVGDIRVRAVVYYRLAGLVPPESRPKK